MSVWRDLTDPRRVAEGVDWEAGLKEPIFENLEIPEELGPVTLVVDDHKIKRYAFTQDDYHPWHLSASPLGERIAHAGLLTNDIVQLFTTRYAASRTVGLHTEEQLWYDDAVRLGEQVTLTGRYVEAYQRRGQGYVVMEAAATGEDGRSLLRARGVEILRTVPGEIAGRGSTQADSAAAPGRVTGEFDASLPFADRAGTGLRIGQPLTPLAKTITQEQASVFSRTGEYVRNVHADLDLARKAGLRIPIVQGQQQCGLVTELLTRFFGLRWFTSGWVRTKFVNPVEVFEPLEVGGVVTDLTEQDGRIVAAELHVWVRRADGRLSTVGWASCEVEETAETEPTNPT
ncbi:MaoC family dehydratase [Actinoalloteichus hymeniacidonis]|uniref:Acyl dehydratase n=1 Tax=Actinoalloteichus hymeniacidonis TaxID=340345 RepID=A0AAC9HQA0_9PSEU|nr:MaoC/PaaZ C-terminal domain-containing protein [Actinoalloteichus hymeniacidonis]AOS63393.1 acyl dehydratase [Actinoalloteichus hymeniacidonis]MBB5908566.1 acyl dehydratase [Actinoalloteichus hymeniacidonis]